MKDDKLKDYLALADAAKRLEMAHAKTEGQLAEAGKRAKSEFGCSTPEQLEAWIARKEAELGEADEEIESDLAAFREKYGKDLEDYL